MLVLFVADKLNLIFLKKIEKDNFEIYQRIHLKRFKYFSNT